MKKSMSEQHKYHDTTHAFSLIMCMVTEDLQNKETRKPSSTLEMCKQLREQACLPAREES